MISQRLSRLGRNILIYGIGGVLSRVVSLLLLPLFTKFLTPTDYGISSILAMVTILTTSVFSLGMGAALGVPYFEASRDNQKAATIWTCFSVLSLSTLILMIIAVVSSDLISEIALGSESYSNLVVLSFAATALSILSTPFVLRTQFEERVRLFVILSIVSTLASAGTSILEIVILRRGVLGLLEANLIGQLVMLSLFMIASIPSTPLHFSWKIAKELLALGVPLVPSFAFLFIIQHGNKYILQWFYGLDAVGIYTIGFSLGMLMSLPVVAFQNAWYPYFMSYAERREEAIEPFSRVLTYYVLLIGGASLFFFAFARPVVSMMTQTAFHEAYQVVGFVASSQFLLGLSSIQLPGIYFAKKIQQVTIVQFLTAVTSVIISVIMIRWFGLIGGAIALPLTMLILNMIQRQWNSRHRYLQVPFEPGRIVKFSIVYLIIAFLSLKIVNLSLFWQIGFSMLLTTCICFTIFALLASSDRAFLIRLIRSSKLRLTRDAVNRENSLEDQSFGK